jgi:hypothetical protein
MSYGFYCEIKGDRTLSEHMRTDSERIANTEVFAWRIIV